MFKMDLKHSSTRRLCV